MASGTQIATTGANGVPAMGAGGMGMFGPQQMSDFLISNLLISKLGGILGNNMEFSLSTILTLIILLSASELKLF